MENSSSPQLSGRPQLEPTDQLPLRRSRGSTLAGGRGGPGAGPRRRAAHGGLGVGLRGRPEAPGRRPLPAARPAGARPPLPVVAVIFERREVLLQLSVRLLESLAQVLELAAERGLEGRVLGVHARTAPALPAPSPASPPPAAPPFVLLLRPSLFQLRGSGAAGALGGTEEEEEQVAGEVGRGRGGRGARRKGAGRAQGAAARCGERSLSGCGWGPPRSHAGLRRGGCRAHQPPPREKEPERGGGGGGESNTRSSDAQDKHMKGHPRSCSYWEKEATGEDRKKGKWGFKAD